MELDFCKLSCDKRCVANIGESYAREMKIYISKTNHSQCHSQTHCETACVLQTLLFLSIQWREWHKFQQTATDLQTLSHGTCQIVLLFWSALKTVQFGQIICKLVSGKTELSTSTCEHTVRSYQGLCCCHSVLVRLVFMSASCGHLLWHCGFQISFCTPLVLCELSP